MNSLFSLINEYRIILGAVFLVIATAFIISRWWNEISFWWLRVSMNVPFFGKMTRLSKNHSFDQKSSWFNSERELCSEFQPYFEKANLSPEFFDDCKSYLRKAHELGRNKLSILGWLLLAVMVFLEAMGFSYVLAGWTIPGASEALKQQGALAIAVLISIILVFLTHSAGHELHQNSLIKKVRAWFNQDREKTHNSLVPNNKVSLDNENIDDEEPIWRQLLSRLPANAAVKPSYKITAAAVLAIVLIASGATFVRGQVLEKELAEQHQLVGSGDIYTQVDPYAQDLPTELLQSQQSVDEDIAQDVREAERKGGWVTFLVLAVIFIFLQIIGIVIGMKSGFAGKESPDARKFIGRFKTREEFDNYYQRKRNFISQIAQRNLEKLQSKMSITAQETNIDSRVEGYLLASSERSFLGYAQDSSKATKNYNIEEAAIQASSVQIETNIPAKTEQQETDLGLPEEEITSWMEKLGWERERTIELLLKHKAEQQKAQEKSEAEALEMLRQQSTQEAEPLSEEEALKMLNEEKEEQCA